MSRLPDIAAQFSKLTRLALPRVQKLGLNSRKLTNSCCEGLELGAVAALRKSRPELTVNRCL